MQRFKDIEETLEDRLKQVIKKYYGSQKEFANQFNVNPSIIAGWWARRSKPRTEILQEICEKTDVSMDWLVLGRNIPTENTNITIPYYTQAVSAGKGILGQDQTKIPLKINKDWIEKEFYKIDFTKLFAVTARGESMEPEIKNGDTLIVEETQILTEGIYIINYMGDVFVKKLQKTTPNELRIISLNKDYKPIDLSLDSITIADFNIIGRVIFNLRKYSI